MARYQEKETQILGISFDTIAENRAFAEKFDFNFPLLSDVDRKIGLAYGACDAPDAKHARRISYLIGADGNIIKSYSNVDAARHPEQVLKDL